MPHPPKSRLSRPERLFISNTLRHRHAVVLGKRRVIAEHVRAPGQGFGIRFFIVGPRERKMGENIRLGGGR